MNQLSELVDRRLGQEETWGKLQVVRAVLQWAVKNQSFVEESTMTELMVLLDTFHAKTS